MNISSTDDENNTLMWQLVKAGVKAKDECLARPCFTVCICKVDEASCNSQDQQGVNKETVNCMLQLNATVTFAEEIFIT